MSPIDKVFYSSLFFTRRKIFWFSGVKYIALIHTTVYKICLILHSNVISNMKMMLICSQFRNIYYNKIFYMFKIRYAMKQLREHKESMDIYEKMVHHLITVPPLFSSMIKNLKWHPFKQLICCQTHTLHKLIHFPAFSVGILLFLPNHHWNNKSSKDTELRTGQK